MKKKIIQHVCVCVGFLALIGLSAEPIGTPPISEILVSKIACMAVIGAAVLVYPKEPKNRRS